MRADLNIPDLRAHERGVTLGVVGSRSRIEATWYGANSPIVAYARLMFNRPISPRGRIDSTGSHGLPARGVEPLAVVIAARGNLNEFANGPSRGGAQAPRNRIRAAHARCFRYVPRPRICIPRIAVVLAGPRNRESVFSCAECRGIRPPARPRRRRGASQGNWRRYYANRGIRAAWSGSRLDFGAAAAGARA